MLHKTQNSIEDTLSIQTKFQPTKAASFTAPPKRQMYSNKTIQNSNKVQTQKSNIITLQPQSTSFLITNQIYFIDNSQTYITITDYHYCLCNDRAKPIMLSRDCQPNSQLLFVNIKKPGITICLESVHRFSNNDYSNILHINLTKYNTKQNNISDCKNIYIEYQPNLLPISFVTLQNSKRGLLISQIQTKSTTTKQYKIMYINLLKANKTKNPKHISMLKQSSFSLSLSLSNNNENISQQVLREKEYLFNPIEKIIQNVQLEQNQYIVKVINSQFGDAVLVITNLEIYQVEFQGKAIYLKKIYVFGKIGKYLMNGSTGDNKNKDNKSNKDQANQNKDKDSFKIDDQIIDTSYVVDGLKIIFITSKGIIGSIQAQNITYAKSLHQILTSSTKKQQLPTNIKLKQMHIMLDKIIILLQNNTILILKITQKQIVYYKKIQLPVTNNDIISYKINVLNRYDEIILQKITKNNKTNNYLQLQVSLKNLLSAGNQFVNLYNANVYQNHQKFMASLKIVTAKANSISCMLKQNTITFYKINNDDSEHSAIQLLFSKNFFEKPIYVSIDPYASNIIIHFKQFVKLYKFHYNDITQFYTYNVRNVAYAGYSDNGQYIIVAVDDLLYFVNSCTFYTQRVIQMYGDIKSIRFYDDMLYVLSKPKVAKNNIQTLTLQIFTYHKNDYSKIFQNKLQPTQALYTDHNFCIIASSTSIQVYTKKIQIYEDEKYQSKKNTIPKKLSTNDQCQSTILMSNKRKIKLIDANQYPTCITLCEQFGVIFIGTNFGRVYEYLWPFVEQEQIQSYYCIQCSVAQITTIQISATYQTLQIFSKSTSVLHCKIVQYVQGEQMPNIYIISPKTLYSNSQQPLKYHLTNRQYLFPKSTSYIFQDLRQANQNIQQFKFIFQKTKDDIQQFVNKESQKIKQQVQKLKKQKDREIGVIKKEKIQNQKNNQVYNKQLAEQLEILRETHKNKVKTQKDQYQKSLLGLYKEACRLRGIYQQLQKQQRHQKDVYLIQNNKIIQNLRAEGQKAQLQYKKKFQQIHKSSTMFQSIQKQQAFKKIDEELLQYKQAIRNAVDLQLQTEQQRKQSLLGSNGYYQKQITNYIRRRDQFQALIMETHIQIEQLYTDEGSYAEKVKYLKNQLNKKQRMIQEKQKQLVKLIDNSVMMKKLKQTHQFQLNQYEKEFQPILSKISVIEQQVQKMNGQILRQYLNKVDKDKQIMQNKKLFQKLKKKKQKKIRCKLDSHTQLQRFLAQLEILLQKPSDQKLRSNLNILSLGQKFMIDEQQVKQTIQNAKIMRRKQFIGKQIEQHQKRQQQVIRNQNQINRHYNQNTMLVRQFNNLTQLNRKLEQMLKQVEIKFLAAKATRLETPKRKTNSVIELKKYSEQKLTPFQKHQRQFNQMFNKGITTQTKISNTGKSMSLLKTLIKDVDGTDSKYQKMQLIRDRIKSFVNPQIRIRKTLATQRALFDKKKVESQYQNYK